MVVANAGANAAIIAAAAAAHARMLEQEEHEMTGYTPQDLADGWEFKILRSATSRFKYPEYLRQCLEEEAKAGWVMVEKFDDSRVRLKRPSSARAKDQALGVDPYRTWVGVSQNQLGLRVAGSIIGFFILVGAVVAIVKALT